MDTSELKHSTEGNIEQGPFVLVLQDGAIITSEDRAMLQALYSRSPASVLFHLKKLAEIGSGKFMDQFYVGYGHKSIGDCGDTTIFIEGVSMLVAKAIQDSLLYCGQEVSTRYLDFGTQPFVAPYVFAHNPQEEMREFYLKAFPRLKEYLKTQYSRNQDEKESLYEKAIAARSFDILRGFLPAGAQTNLSWTSNLRQAADKIAYLRVHPLKEVRVVAEMILSALKKAHPHSFNQKHYEQSDEYRRHYMAEMYYFNPPNMGEGVHLMKNSLDQMLLEEYSVFIDGRPEKTELPKALAEIGTLQFEFMIDFGSFRDIQRQRAVIQRMPLLTPELGFGKWYLDQLGPDLIEEAKALVEKISTWWEKEVGTVEKEILQYFLPMGFCVPCRVTGDLPALIYLVELRSGSTVHPTLRVVAQQMGQIIDSLGIKVYVDKSDIGRFDVRRGTQDIVAKLT